MKRDSERERERESFIRNNLHNGVVSGAARGQALLGPTWPSLVGEGGRAVPISSSSAGGTQT